MIDLVILFVLLNRDLTMYAIQKHILDNFKVYTNPSFGALKPALVRLENEGCIKSARIMSEGGKLSVFYSITKDGLKHLRNLLIKPFSGNPLQFLSDSRIKLSCTSFLKPEDAKLMFDEIKTNAILHKINAQRILDDEYNSIDFYQKIVLDNTICEYKNLISMVEGFEKQ
ncbi:helix-turn-helix transcriptional regulator [bacterium]|nr:helix-turn-helix transcriptional regulator [bacterium]